MPSIIARLSNIGEPPTAWSEFLHNHPAFVDSEEWYGDWTPDEPDVRLDGHYTAAQLRAMADYMDWHRKP